MEQHLMMQFLNGVAEASALTSTLYGYLLEKKAEDLFSSHIKSSALSKK
jgi:hypothetical protein